MACRGTKAVGSRVLIHPAGRGEVLPDPGEATDASYVALSVHGGHGVQGGSWNNIFLTWWSRCFWTAPTYRSWSKDVKKVESPGSNLGIGCKNVKDVESSGGDFGAGCKTGNIRGALMCRFGHLCTTIGHQCPRH